MSEEKKSGCLRILAIAGVCFLGLIILGWIFISKSIDKGTEGMRLEFDKKVVELEREGTLPNEQIQTLKNMRNILKNNDSSMFANLLSFGLLMDSVDDKIIDENEYSNILLVEKLLIETNGDVTMTKAGQFFEEHPEINESFQNMQHKYKKQ